MVGLSANQAAQMKNHTLSLVTLAEDGGVSVLKSREFLLVTLPLTLKFLSNFLLEDKGFESIVTLLLSSRKAGGKACGIILLLVNETSEASVLPLVVLNLDLELLSLLGKLFGESLEFEKLEDVSKQFSMWRLWNVLVVSSSRAPQQGSCFFW